MLTGVGQTKRVLCDGCGLQKAQGFQYRALRPSRYMYASSCGAFLTAVKEGTAEAGIGTWPTPM